ncbi:c-type cytochrome [Sulfurospirillum sp. 1612]|uniref:c-type cytochrome n=1 Tax=Sulfurospirillum sp. 1612 TaxID=3094835 RepID=UPI002F9532FC
MMFIKKSLVLIFCCFSTLVYATTIKAVLVPGDVFGITPNSKAWISTDSTTIFSYPLRPHNTQENISTQNQKKSTTIKALYDGKNVAILFKWKAPLLPKENNTTTILSENFTVQIPKEGLPYVNMGYQDAPVLLYTLRANEEINATTRRLQDANISESTRLSQAQGPEHIKELFPLTQDYTMHLIYKKGYYLASFTRVLKSTINNLNSGVFAISFSSHLTFQNDNNHTQYLSPWIAIQLSGEHGNDTLRERLNMKATGDIAKGAKIAYENCAICHRYKDVKRAPEDMAPDLSFAGGLYDLNYLKESLIHPSKVIMKSYRDDNQTNAAWSGTNEAGESTSTMPSFEWLSQQEMDDLLTFLQTLK